MFSQRQQYQQDLLQWVRINRDILNSDPNMRERGRAAGTRWLGEIEARLNIERRNQARHSTYAGDITLGGPDGAASHALYPGLTSWGAVAASSSSSPAVADPATAPHALYPGLTSWGAVAASSSSSPAAADPALSTSTVTPEATAATGGSPVPSRSKYVHQSSTGSTGNREGEKPKGQEGNGRRRSRSRKTKSKFKRRSKIRKKNTLKRR